MNKCLMIQGTSSDVGKTILVAGICRVYSRRGYKVTPFKSQNMSSNSYITEDNKELAIAQFIQAKAANIKLTEDMNPILLKPQKDYKSKVFIHGEYIGGTDFNSKIEFKEIAKAAIEDSLNRLKEKYDIIIMEGAGSSAEINLRDGDLANMGVAEIADANVLLVGDIEKGGVFASIAGTFVLLDDIDSSRIKGVIINKFRGNVDLLDKGIKKLENIIKVPVLGVIPWIDELKLPAEDSAPIINYNEEEIEKSLEDLADILEDIIDFNFVDKLIFDN